MFVKQQLLDILTQLKEMVCIFVICHHQAEDEESLRQEINELVSKIVGPIESFR